LPENAYYEVLMHILIEEKGASYYKLNVIFDEYTRQRL